MENHRMSSFTIAVIPQTFGPFSIELAFKHRKAISLKAECAIQVQDLFYGLARKNLYVYETKWTIVY
jgi:hypothetical protein